MFGTNNTVSTSFPISLKNLLGSWPVAVSLSLVLLPVITHSAASLSLWLFITHIVFCSYFVFKNQLVKRKQILKFDYLSHTFFNGLLAGLVLWVILSLILNPVLNHLTGVMTNYVKFNVLRHNIPLTLKATAGMWLTAAIGEEIIFRGFLLDRFIQLSGNKYLPILISSLLFSLIHFYQGTNGVVTTFVAGVLFGLLYLRSDKNLLLLILSHGFTDTMFFASVCFNYDATFLISRLF